MLYNVPGRCRDGRKKVTFLCWILKSPIFLSIGNLHTIVLFRGSKGVIEVITPIVAFGVVFLFFLYELKGR
jgi:hypothetical protein